MKINHTIFACLVSITAFTSASAADVVVSAPTKISAPSPYDTNYFTGAYLGAQLGGSWLSQDSYVDSLANQGVNSSYYFPKASGFLGGVYLGYNFPLSTSVIGGIETDFAWSNITGAKSVDDANQQINSRLEQKWNGATRMRLGFDTGLFFPYIAGGIAYAQFKNSINLQNNTDTYTGFGNDVQTGYTLGAGMDILMNENILLRLEYRYNDYGSTSYSSEQNENVNVNSNYKTNDVRVGVAYKF